MSSILSNDPDLSDQGPGQSPASDDDSLLLAELCDEFTCRRRAGESVTVTDYAAQYPKLADQILAIFPALLMLDGCCDNRVQQVVPQSEADPVSIAGYQVIRRLGSGGMGVVYEATHPRVSRRMALKLLRPQKSNSEQLQERFLREAEAASRLNHPSIVPFLDCGIDGEAVYLSMLFVDGTSMDHVLQNYWDQQSSSHDLIASDFQRIARLGADVAAALAHAHDRGTIHRDIKPANLILDHSGKIWVTDFGLAKLRDDDSGISHTGDMIGTPRYMAPEQLRGHADERSDVYALGVTLYELATGCRAWASSSNSELIRNRSAFELPDIADVSPRVPADLSAIIMKACAHAPLDRYQSAGELQHDLNQFGHGEAISDRRQSNRSGGPPRRKPMPMKALIIVGATIGLLAVAAVYNVAMERHTQQGSHTSDGDLKPQSDRTFQKFKLRKGRPFDHTVMPTIERHTGLILWWVSGGEDAELFEVDRSSGRLRMLQTASHDLPRDANADNVYRVTIGMRSSSATEYADVEVEVHEK